MDRFQVLKELCVDQGFESFSDLRTAVEELVLNRAVARLQCTPQSKN
jgi:hypothetical protein